MSFQVAWPPVVSETFPLSVSGRGYFKSIRGRTVWIAGKVSPEEAMRCYHAKASAILCDRPVLPLPGPMLLVRDVIGRFIKDKRQDYDQGNLSLITYVQYLRSMRSVRDVVGDQPVSALGASMLSSIHDGLLVTQRSEQAKKIIRHLLIALRHAQGEEWIEGVAVGRGLRKKIAVGQAGMRWKLPKPAEVRDILAFIDGRISDYLIAGERDTSPLVRLRANILLAVNGGMGAAEQSELLKEQVDDGWIRHSRGKTGMLHAVPLWEETITALAPVLKMRPDDPRLFTTRCGRNIVHSTPVMRDGRITSASLTDSVNQMYSKILCDMGIKRGGVGFYKLKHLHCTLADEAGDPHATFTLAGHGLPGSKKNYVKVSDARLRAVSEFVRGKILGT